MDSGKTVAGLGGAMRQTVIKQSDFQIDKKACGHFHNSYIEFTSVWFVRSYLIIVCLRLAQ